MTGSDTYGSEAEWSEQYTLGFVEKPDYATSLLRHRFRSKVGGRPAWLDPVNLPSPAQLECSLSGRPMLFLLQVYAAAECEPSAFHRFIFLFISPAGNKLTEPGAVKAFRCQLPRYNKFYDSKKSDEALPPQAQDRSAYDPWKVADAEDAMRQGASVQDLRDLQTFTEHELVCEPEEEPESSEQDMMSQLKLGGHASPSDQGDSDPESRDIMNSVEAQTSPEQQHYAEFAARVCWEPEQVLRYCFSEAAQPLWPSLEGAADAEKVPPCPHCGAARHFEFQVMPQLLNHLGVDHSIDEAPDWGTIVVYSCAVSCKTAEAYTEEHVWVQAA